jgi:hypothetical protein
VSDTPRTEAEVNRQKCWSDDLITIDANFACQLERELNAANDRIKRLEEALEGTVKWIVHLADSGDAGFWNPEEQSVIIAARAALQAKEAKL